MKTRSVNPELWSLASELRKGSRDHHAPIWGRIADFLEKSRRGRVAVNVGQVARLTEKGETIAVPGKVLGTGILEHKLTVAAFKFTPEARNKIERAGGKCVSLKDLLKEKPQGTKVRIIT